MKITTKEKKGEWCQSNWHHQTHGAIILGKPDWPNWGWTIFQSHQLLTKTHLWKKTFDYWWNCHHNWWETRYCQSSTRKTRKKQYLLPWYMYFKCDCQHIPNMQQYGLQKKGCCKSWFQNIALSWMQQILVTEKLIHWSKSIT